MPAISYWIKKYDPELIDYFIEHNVPGEYTLPEFLGDTWRWVLHWSVWGRLVKRDVRQNGRFPRLRWLRQRSDKKQVYELLPA